MIESPLIKELVAESNQKARQEATQKTKQEDLEVFLKGRFGKIPSEVIKRIRKIQSETKLQDLIEFVARCPNQDAFREKLGK